jgi:rRNA pseudouridine-1189 N-methylase Emg1 (Nep1/Mra1 family)
MVAAYIMSQNRTSTHGNVDGALRIYNQGREDRVTTVTRGWRDGIPRSYEESVHLHEHMLHKMGNP